MKKEYFLKREPEYNQFEQKIYNNVPKQNSGKKKQKRVVQY